MRKQQLLLLAFSTVVAHSVHAATYTWDTNGASKLWNATDANWTGAGAVWIDNNDAIFDAATGDSVSKVGTLAPLTTTIGANNGNWTLDGTGTIGGTLLKTGTGTLTLATANALTGATVSQGSLVLSQNAGVSGTATNVITLGDANTGSANVSLLLAANINNVAVANNIVVANTGTGTVTIGTAGGTVSNGRDFSGSVTLNRATTIQGLNTDLTRFTGAISGTVGTLTIAGTQRVVFTGTNSFVGDVLINSGAILQLGTNSTGNRITDTSNVTVNGTLRLSQNGVGNSETISALTGSGTINSNGAGGLTVSSGNFTGTIGTGGTSVALTKTGAGTLTLSGTNTYTGGTTVANSGGTLAITNSSALGTGTVTLSKSGTSTGYLQLQLTGTNTISNTFGNFNSATGGAGNAQIRNVSGNNTITSALTLTGTGGNGVVVQSDAGAGNFLTLSGNMTTTQASRTNFLGGAGDGLVSGVIGGGSGNATFGLTKEGSGTWTLSGSNTYGGTTNVAAGKLLINGTNSGTGAGTVATGAIIGGTGSFAGALNVTGTLAPGASIESFATGALPFNTGSTFAYEFDSSAAPGAAADLQLVNGDLSLTGVVNLGLSDLATSDVVFTNGTVLSLINYSGVWNNGVLTFGGNDLANGEEFSDGLNTWRIDYNATTGGSNFSGEYITGSFVNLTAVPEPSVALLSVLSTLPLFRRRR